MHNHGIRGFRAGSVGMRYCVACQMKNCLHPKNVTTELKQSTPLFEHIGDKYIA